jgi:hypothetical protein
VPIEYKVYSCSHCGKHYKESEIEGLSLHTDSYTDAAGDTDYHHVDADLCRGCTSQLISALVTLAGRKRAAMLLKQFGGKEY